MNPFSRRDFLKLSSAQIALLNFYPQLLLAKELTSDQDLLFLKPKDRDYQKFSTPFNQRIKTSPQLMAVCLNESGVQKAVQHANQNKLKIAVKSGGHSFEGFSLNADGLVIDVSQMKNRTLDQNSFTAGPGLILSEVYDFLLPKGRILPAGSCGTVGLSGLTLGGGYGLFARKWGLSCDHLTGLRMVDAQGEIHDSKDEPELLWACRGGGNGNFGIITELRYDTQPAPKRLARHRIKFRNLNPQRATALCRKWFRISKSLPNDAFSAFVLNGRHLSILITYFEEDSKAPIAKLAKLLAQGAHSVSPFAQEALPKALTRYYGRKEPLHFKNVSAGFYNDFSDLKEGLEEVFELVFASRSIFQINTLGGMIADDSKSKTAAYPHRMAAYLGELQNYWDRDSQTATKIAQVNEIQTKLQDMGINKHYRNYPSLELDNWQEAYYGKANYQRLQECKERYDPNDQITHRQSVKLPELKK